MKYQLLALDMDGTLLNDNHEISPETAHWIGKAKDAGIHVCLSTGRPFSEAVPFGDQLGLSTPMVTVNGSEIWRSPHELYHRELFDTAIIRKLYAIAEQHDVWFWAYAVEGAYNKKSWDSSLLDTNQWIKFGYHTENAEIRHQILLQLQEVQGLEITNSSLTNYEINPAGVNKATGIKVVCELLGLEMNQVIAVGDSLNDLAVIQAAGLGVAMGNAQITVKENADYVTSSNNDDGIAEVIRKFIFSEEQD
ncbi:phosphoglycolate phosphatase (TIGR01487 family) [Paenibacillus shirakamiensis]|uniref:Phosphoglycolate phosphatase (TIGR01487 family) n=1 Tax=Paenibacillus shirakamiensis TaxID=1265935 RepID=A0ABS4JM57_9BACL|nr:phosphoglycolate phosphatase (TIGR01487 family) [Paenibacillus shirakamiensis]